MSEVVNEALLEMYFLQALIEDYSKKYGVKFLKLLKPSPQNETWVGFDQGWVHTSLSMSELYEELKENIRSVSIVSKHLFLGFFLQFKIVDRIKKSSSLMPSGYRTPYYRSELSLKPNERTGLSQHETLLILSRIKNANVFYACGMLFEINQIYSKPDIADLRMVPINTAPVGWNTNERHFITFQAPNDPGPWWCSKPSEGVSYSVDQWFSKDIGIGPKPMNAEEIRALIIEAAATLENQYVQKENLGQMDLFSQEKEGSLPESFTLIEFQRE